MTLALAGSPVSAGRGGYTTFPIPIDVDGQDIASEIYLRVREARYDFSPRKLGQAKGDRKDIFAGKTWAAIRDGDAAAFGGYCAEGMKAKNRGLFSYLFTGAQRIHPTRVAARYDLGNISYFILDAGRGDPRFLPLLLLEDRGALGVDSFGAYLLPQLLTRIWLLRASGRKEFEPIAAPPKDVEEVTLPLRFFRSDDGRPQAQLVTHGAAAENAVRVLLRNVIVGDFPTTEEGVQAAALSGEAREVLLAYARSRQAVRNDDKESFVASFSEKSRPWVRKWLANAGGVGWKMLLHKPAGNIKRVRALIDGGPVWIVIHQDEPGTAYAGPTFAYDMLVRDPKTSKFVRSHFQTTSAVDGILSDPAFFLAFARKFHMPIRCDHPLCAHWPED